tara:strand:- start:209 stop:802 length:594 start_codon:yes stop_codon:yes gene_type:complete
MNKARKYSDQLAKTSLICVFLGILFLIITEIILTEQTTLRSIFQIGASLLLVLLLIFLTGSIILLLYSKWLDVENNYRLRLQQQNEENLLNLIRKAKEREQARDYDNAIEIWEELGEIEQAARVRKIREEMSSVKIAQKVVQGDEISKTEIKDSVLNRSSVSGSSSKMQELKDLTEMKEKGLISDEEFEKMKKEIIE